MKIFKLRQFLKFAKKEKIDDSVLITVVLKAQEGYEMDSLGSDVYKKKMNHPAQGRTGEIRLILAFRKDVISIYIDGYLKGKKDDLAPEEEDAARELAKDYFAYNDTQLKDLIDSGEIVQVEEN